MGEYDDIIDPPYPISKRHSSMPVADRAAQFAALTGYGGTIGEAARLMDERAELGADDRRELNEKLRLLIASAEHHPEQSAMYFETDAKRQAAGMLSGEYRPHIDAAVRTAHPYCCEDRTPCRESVRIAHSILFCTKFSIVVAPKESFTVRLSYASVGSVLQNSARWQGVSLHA